MISSQINWILAAHPDAKRPSRVNPHQKPVIRCPTQKVVSCLQNVTMRRSLEVLAREVARVQGQPAGQRGGQLNLRRKRASSCAEVRTGSVWTTAQPSAHAGRFDVAPAAKSCEDTGNTTELSNRSWDAPQICEGTRALSGRRGRNRRGLGCVFERLLCPGRSAPPGFTTSCCRDGPLAVVQPLWVQKNFRSSIGV